MSNNGHPIELLDEESLRIDSCDGASPPRNGKVEDFLFYRQAGLRSREWIMRGMHAYKHWSPHEDRLTIRKLVLRMYWSSSNLWTPLVLTNSLFQTFSRWSLNVKTKTTWFDCHTNRPNKQFLSLSITFFLVIVFLQFLRIETFWYQISYYPLFVGSQRGPSSFYGSWLIRMVSRRASLIQSQKYQLLKVVNNCYYKNVEPTLPILTDVHHDICGRTSNRSLAGKPVKVATLTHTRD